MAEDYFCKECGVLVVRLEKGAYRKGSTVTCPKCERDLYGNCGTNNGDSMSVNDLLNMFGMNGGR